MTKKDYSANSFYPQTFLKSKCAGKNCQRKASRILEIKLLHKKGGFCETCSIELRNLGLVEAFSGDYK